jgi:transcriptional regulator with GAF, ATPase, and Fis domain
LEVQVKLLRVLQEKEFDRVGGKSPIAVDVRVIAATNRDLLAAVRDKTFREDLYYRLNVFPVLVPPLRERKEDIPLLAHFLIRKFGTKIGKTIEQISDDAISRLCAYHWPGNIRELENIIERALIVSPGPVLRIDAELLSAAPPSSKSADSALVTIERDHIQRVLIQTGGVIEGPSGAARILDMHPNTLRSRIRKLGIRRSDRRDSEGRSNLARDDQADAV